MSKIVMIGVGSISFGAKTIGDLIHFKDILKGSIISLVDIDEEKLRLMKGLIDKMNKDAGMPFKIEASTQRRDVLTGADFVVTSPAIKREELWKQDWTIINRAGIKQTYGENGGPGSLALTMRNIPMILSIAKDVEELAPNAWLINFTNPEARICMALDRYSSVKFVGLCHQIYESYKTIHTVLGIEFSDIDVKAAGTNHLTWIYDIRRKSTGRSIYKEFSDKLKEMPENYEPMSRKLFSMFGMYPTSGDHHLAEFMPFGWEYQGLLGRDFESRKKKIDDTMEWLRGVNNETRQVGEIVSGKSTESVADIIAAMTTGDNHYEVSLDIRNNGCIPNLPDNAIVEVPGVVSGDKVRGLRMDPLPEGIVELIRRQITVQSLSVEAAITGSRDKALQAFILDPVVDNISTAEKVLDELIQANKEYIHQGFVCA
ncbi:MAG TPA: hypothetical protein PK733_12945 [Clostridiales bacterium]|nr:hypothetical protein [Clostridiales bacterium]